MLTAKLVYWDIYELLESGKRIGECRLGDDQEIRKIAQANGFSAEEVTKALESAMYSEMRKRYMPHREAFSLRRSKERASHQ